MYIFENIMRNNMFYINQPQNGHGGIIITLSGDGGGGGEGEVYNLKKI